MPMPSVVSRRLRSPLANARSVISEVVAAPRERRIAKFVVRLHNSVSRRSIRRVCNSAFAERWLWAKNWR